MADIQSVNVVLNDIKDLLGGNLKQLADGQLPDSVGDLYTVPADTQVKIYTMTFMNTHSSGVTMNLLLLPAGGTARELIPTDMPLSSKYLMVFDDAITLDTGDKIRGDASVASKVDYTISGVTQP